MDKALKSLQMAISIKDNIQLESQMVMVNIIGLLAVILKAISKMVWEMVTECGKKAQEIATNMKENIVKIASMDMAFLVGQVVIFIREIISMTLDQVLAKCIGVMAVIIKDNGKMEYSMDKVIYIVCRHSFCPRARC